MYVVMVIRNSLDERARKCHYGRSTRAKAMNLAKRRNRRDDWQDENAMLNGMAFGCDGYNDTYGY